MRPGPMGLSHFLKKTSFLLPANADNKKLVNVFPLSTFPLELQRIYLTAS